MTKELLRRLRAESLARRFIYRPEGGKPGPHPLSLAPFILRRVQAAALLPLAKAVFKLHRRLPSLTRQGFPGLSGICPLEPRAREWLALAPDKPADMILRLDVGLSGRDFFLYETNATALAGYHYQTAAAAITRSLGLADRLGDAPNLLEFLRDWLEKACGRKRRIGFVEPAPFGPGDTEMPEVARYLRTRGWQAVWGAPSDLSRKAGGWALRGQEIDFVFRDVCYKDMRSPSSPKLKTLVEMLRAGRALPGPGAEFDHKGMLELCTSEEFARLWTRSEARSLKAHVPWTRIARERKTSGPDGRTVDLLEFLRLRPDRWLLKPNRDCGGAGIVFGCEGRASWDQALDRAAREPGDWVVQERRQAAETSILIPRGDRAAAQRGRAALGVYYGGQKLGFYARVSRGLTVNVAQGGALAAVFFAR